MVETMIGFLATSFVGLTYIAHVLESTVINSADVAVLNQMGITQRIDIGFMSIPVPGLNYIQGIMQLGSFDYSTLFTGNAQLLLFLIYSIIFVIGFTLFLTVVGLGVNAIRVH